MMRTYCLSLLLLLSLSSWALTRYSCTFESTAEQDAWTLNTGRDGADCVNRWYCGEAGANQGHYGLFVSDDGQHATYNTTTAVGGVVCSTNIDLQSDTYTLSFNWALTGLQLDTTGQYLDRLYVCWVPSADDAGNPISINSNKRTLPAWVRQYALPVSPVGYLAGARSWATCQVSLIDTVHFRGQGPYRLAFVWANGDSTAIPPSAKIDNILIQPASLCPSPTQLSYSLQGQEIHVQWSGHADQYLVRCYCHESKRNYTRTTTDTRVVFDEVPEGRVDIYVQAQCGDDVSPVVSTTGLVYYPGTRCINFLDLNQANCYVSEGFKFTTDPIQWSKKQVDYGYESAYSRHTVHYVREERDPNTQSLLPTVPDDEIAAVRLGNMRTGAECERIEYNLHIDAEVNPVLVLKYAIVMENPEGHSTYEQPRFTLRILRHGQSVNNPCTEADFTADHIDTIADPSWHRWSPGHTAATDIVWKEWTTVGVDLSEYDGEDLVVQLTSYDCSQTGHFGYVYFTLSCSDGQFKDLACGQVNPTFYAPAGFLYRWYRKGYNGDILSRSDTLQVGYQDTLTYACDMMFPKDTTCFFTLYADAMARFPIPELDYSVTHECNNLVAFTERSHLLVRNHVSGQDNHDYRQLCDYTQCLFHDGTTTRDAQFQKVFPPEGGTFPVVVQSFYSTCDSIDTIYITLPDVRPVIDTLRPFLCEKDTPYVYRDMRISQTGVYFDSVPNLYGCYDWTRLDVTVLNTDSFVVQRWNDVLAVRNADYNGGYEFSAYQWYKNGEPIPGETGSTLYEPAGLQTDQLYSVLLTLKDGAQMDLCPFYPKHYDGLSDQPILQSVVRAGERLLVPYEGTVVWYDLLGRMVQQETSAGSFVTVPLLPGMYLLTFSGGSSASTPRSSQHILVQQ